MLFASKVQTYCLFIVFEAHMHCHYFVAFCINSKSTLKCIHETVIAEKIFIQQRYCVQKPEYF